MHDGLSPIADSKNGTVVLCSLKAPKASTRSSGPGKDKPKPQSILICCADADSATYQQQVGCIDVASSSARLLQASTPAELLRLAFQHLKAAGRTVDLLAIAEFRHFQGVFQWIPNVQCQV